MDDWMVKMIMDRLTGVWGDSHALLMIINGYKNAEEKAGAKPDPIYYARNLSAKCPPLSKYAKYGLEVLGTYQSKEVSIIYNVRDSTVKGIRKRFKQAFPNSH